MHRHRLIRYKGMSLAPDTAWALEILDKKTAEAGWRLDFIGPSPEVTWNAMSLIPAGREVHLRLVKSNVTSHQTILNALWSFAVPLGFTPWNRYPIAGQEGNHIFHHFGFWRVLYDRLMAEGRGHLCWPSVCAAAQCDIGAWQGNKKDERFVQAQLHRLGRNCGPVDGIIGPRTADAIESLGIPNAGFPQILEYVRTAEPPSSPKRTRHVGHVAIPGRNLTLSSYGDVRTMRTKQGATLTIDGPGRVIVDIGESE